MASRTTRIVAAVAAVAVVAAGAATAVVLTRSPSPHAVDPVRAADEQFYFLMADRFANGDPTNDTGGLGDDPMVSGYDPTNSAFYQGGDLAGVLEQLDYIEGLGTTAIWLSPSFTNKAVQPEDNSAGYHGYWITDFTTIDPHLGTNDDLAALVDAAHERGMKVFFDIITNHTADVIGYADGGRMPYVSKDERPYTDAAGEAFDDRDSASADSFAALDAGTSFPYVPVLEPGEENLKSPAWLNDVTLYHNRGNTTFTGEDSLYGDFVGLDDLFTENPVVVDGMIDIYEGWIRDFGIDGFRIDTMRHVDDAFWRRFGPEVLQFAHEQGKDEFLMFGEVFDTSRAATSHFTTTDDIQAVLDFPFQDAARSFASRSRSAEDLAAFYADDDWYTDADSNASMLPTFLGNHDMGRFGGFLEADNPRADDAELLARDALAHALMMLTRGSSVVYYGDEQGLTGDGGDRAARQPLFATGIAEYLDDDLIGTDASLATDSYDAAHPLYEDIAALAALVESSPALATGAQITRYADDAVYAFSRFDRDTRSEVVVALNNSDEARTATVPTYSADAGFTDLAGGSQTLRTDADGALTVTVPAFGWVVYQADQPADTTGAAPMATLAEPQPSADDAGRVEVAATLDTEDYAEVSFWAKPEGEDWTHIGTDDAPPYRVFHDVTDLGVGSTVEYAAVASDGAGHDSTSASVTGTVPAPAVTIVSPEIGSTLGDAPVIAATVSPDRPDTVVTIERRFGNGEWEAVGSDDSAPTYSVTDDLTDVEPGTEVQYRAVASTGGGTAESIAISAKSGALAQPTAVALPGSFNELQGCDEWWMPACDAVQMTLDEAAGTWSLAVDLPAGAHEYKIAIDGSWAENYGAGGVPDGPNMVIELEAPATVVFVYDPFTHLVTATPE